jgi:hypothetical protein
MDSAEAIHLYVKALQLTRDPLRAAAFNNLGNECAAIGDDERAAPRTTRTRPGPRGPVRWIFSMRSTRLPQLLTEEFR